MTWASSFGLVTRAGVQGTGCCGAAVKARPQAIIQIKSTLVGAPDPLRELRSLKTRQLIDRRLRRDRDSGVECSRTWSSNDSMWSKIAVRSAAFVGRLWR